MSITATGEFDFNLHRGALAVSPGKNVFVSPTSIEICFAMALNGARGETKAAMLSTLGLPADASYAKINERYGKLIAALHAVDPKIVLAIANSIWLKKGYEFKKPFLDRNKKSFNATVQTLNFEDVEGSLKIMNGWCDEKTHGKIKSILDDIPAEAFVYLMNAVYMKAPWTVEFNKELTRPREFNLANGGKIVHPTMMRKDDMDYLETDAFQAVRLPYASGRLGFYVFLPKQASGLEAFHQSLNAANWASWMGSFESVEGTLWLPRFKNEYDLDLTKVLPSMGMGIAFSGSRADFKAMAHPRFGGNFYIGEAKHKTFVEVNEEGTEAAAVTVIGGFECTSIRIKREFFMNVDRPFFCAIRDDQTGTNLFLGSIIEPK